MDIYHVETLPMVKESFAKIFLNKAKFLKSGAENFRNEYKKALKNLKVIPQSGGSIFIGYHTKVIMGCVLLYRIDEVKKIVSVFDIVDPRQDTKARKYR